MVDSGPAMYDYHYRLSKIVVEKVERGGSEKTSLSSPYDEIVYVNKSFARKGSSGLSCLLMNVKKMWEM